MRINLEGKQSNRNVVKNIYIQASQIPVRRTSLLLDHVFRSIAILTTPDQLRVGENI